MVCSLSPRPIALGQFWATMIYLCLPWMLHTYHHIRLSCHNKPTSSFISPLIGLGIRNLQLTLEGVVYLGEVIHMWQPCIDLTAPTSTTYHGKASLPRGMSSVLGRLASTLLHLPQHTTLACLFSLGRCHPSLATWIDLTKPTSMPGTYPRNIQLSSMAIWNHHGASEAIAPTTSWSL